MLIHDKNTKTHQRRASDFSDGAMDALRLMKKHTFLRGMNEPIFCDPVTDQAWTRIGKFNASYFQPTLKAPEIANVGLTARGTGSPRSR